MRTLTGVVIPVVILAAGASRRLGRPKQIERLGGETLLERAVRVAMESGLGTVFAVVDATDGVVVAEARRLRCEVVLNREAEEGMAASIQGGVWAGVRAIGGAPTGMVVMTCDQPAVSAEHLRALAGEGGVVASEYAGRRGVPAYFPASVFGELLALRGDVGARELLRGARAIALEYGELDLDTDEEFEQARVLFGGGAFR